jgi:ABC-type branched-subunit amino acid transport system substrate-binding protein
MRKLRLSLSCLAALSLLATACGRSDDTGTATTTPSETTAPAATSAPAETTDPGSSDTTAATGGDTTAAPSSTAAPSAGDHALTAADIEEQCKSEPLEATEVGVTESEITIEVMADTGSPLAPGLFQGNVDAIKGFADYINANGGIGCRQLKVRTWDSKLDPNESKNGLIDACQNALAMVGNNALFNPDVSAMTNCADQAGAPTGLPDMAALANDVNELCNPTTFTIQYQAEDCPIPEGDRTYQWITGPITKIVEQHPDRTNGMFMVPGDLPTTRQSAMPNVEAQRMVGVAMDNVVLVSGREEQSAYTPRVQAIKGGVNYVYNGSDDNSMIKMESEAAAQGVDPSTVTYACSLACYTRDLLAQGGSTVDGTYVWMQFLPFEEADTNAALQAYVDTIGEDKADSFGAQAWQAAIAFQTAVNQIVAEQGPNAITRASLIEAFSSIDAFTADGWAGVRSLTGISPCYVLLQVQDGEFARVWPEERGTMDCDASNLVELTIDPVAEAAKLG